MPAVKKGKRAQKKKTPSPVERVAALFERYTIAGAAGSVVILLLAGVVLWAGGYFAMAGSSVDRAMQRAAVGAGLEVRQVLLRGAHQTAHQEVLDALGPVIGESILRLSLDEARARVEQIGWVRSAAVTRLLPDTVSIAIREREPAAVWQMNGQLHLIDDSGAMIREVGAYEYSNLPLIVGSGAPEAAAGILQALGARPALQKRVYALVRVGGRRWDMRLRNEIKVKLPEENYERAVDDLALLHSAQATLDQPLEYIDLRDPERMVVRKRGEADATAN
ncbi:MAG TPA: cell division protein FtsQ/DivIB [Parvularculaceae bacterium]|nr:cell division protein FtsQ/DivIB [Parvularculaceae bacterium]